MCFVNCASCALRERESSCVLRRRYVFLQSVEVPPWDVNSKMCLKGKNVLLSKCLILSVKVEGSDDGRAIPERK